jgi:(p)ppGpp synthase/HD superfamily hydrolase
MTDQYDEIILIAEKFARAAHDGQVDKLGVPYIRHVEAVVTLCREFWPSDNFKPHGIAVAWLHDVLEDSDMVLESLAMWFPRSITKAVDAITHRTNEPRSLYYSRVKANYIAHNVKILDVKHNQSRLHLIEDSETRERLTLKYLAAEIALETS